jgi:hypothetical protein
MTLAVMPLDIAALSREPIHSGGNLCGMIGAAVIAAPHSIEVCMPGEGTDIAKVAEEDVWCGCYGGMTQAMMPCFDTSTGAQPSLMRPSRIAIDGDGSQMKKPLELAWEERIPAVS